MRLVSRATRRPSTRNSENDELFAQRSLTKLALDIDHALVFVFRTTSGVSPTSHAEGGCFQATINSTLFGQDILHHAGFVFEAMCRLVARETEEG